MALSHVTKLYAVEDAKISPLTADPSGGTATYGAAIDVPGIKSIGLGPDITSVQLRGDNRELDSDSTLQAMEVTFEHAKLSLDALEVLMGGTTTDAAVTPDQTATFSRVATDAFSYFKLEAKTPTNGGDDVGGDVHIVLYKCKVTDISFGFAEEDYQTVSVTARAVYRAADEKLFDIVQNESAVAIA